MGWFDWMRGWLGIGRRCSRARVCALPSYEFCFFAVTSVTADGVENTSSPKKQHIVLLKTTCCFMESDVSFYGKQRVVLWKVTGCFMENNVSFCGKQRVVLDWRSKSCFEDGVLGIFWGGVVA